jgi:Ca-activated chloride channel family protein
VKFVALGFDVRESDFPLRIAWPLLLLNVINDFVEEDVSYISSFKTGEVWRIPAASRRRPPRSSRCQDGRSARCP